MVNPGQACLSGFPCLVQTWLINPRTLSQEAQLQLQKISQHGVPSSQLHQLDLQAASIPDQPPGWSFGCAIRTLGVMLAGGSCVQTLRP